ncbi:MAG: glycosyltransferase family 2 protein [Clostridia bacterium]|nr:glycosyltransferase family 2 protein [Clostridia bacterium]
MIKYKGICEKEGTKTDILEILKVICATIISIIGVIYSYKTIFTVIGFFFTKKFKAAENLHKYAVVISARNESSVIGNLIESIKMQDYPEELVTVFVVADNCDDNTAEIARARGAVCYERFDKEHATKGFALQFLFKQIERDYGIESFEGYFVFDADNLLKRDFISRMNDAFDSGERIITSYRNTKNLDDNLIAAGYALHWLRTARFESRGRSLLNFSTRLQGTGYLVASDLLKDGWNHTSLTEDREFSTVAAVKGVRISYQHMAEFYDEQPTNLKIVWRQRTRWAKGHLYAFTHCFRDLMRGIVKHKKLRHKLICFDMNLTNTPYCMIMVPLKLISAVLAILTATGDTAWWELVLDILKIVIFEHFGIIPIGLLLFITEHKRIQKISFPKKILYGLTFPLFSMIGDAATWVASVTKVTWQPIPHDAKVKLEELEKKI